jgi:hypothetical protein
VTNLISRQWPVAQRRREDPWTRLGLVCAGSVDSRAGLIALRSSTVALGSTMNIRPFTRFETLELANRVIAHYGVSIDEKGVGELVTMVVNRYGGQVYLTHKCLEIVAIEFSRQSIRPIAEAVRQAIPLRDRYFQDLFARLEKFVDPGEDTQVHDGETKISIPVEESLLYEYGLIGDEFPAKWSGTVFAEVLPRLVHTKRPEA